MARAALRTAGKVADRCPWCGGREPKELVDGGLRTNWAMVLLLLCLTMGVGLLVFRWRYYQLQAYCRTCRAAFDV